MVRTIVLRISAALAVALTAGAVLVATGSSATATQGSAVIAGVTNTETAATVMNNTSGSETCSGYGATDGLVGCGTRGLRGIGTVYGVGGVGGTYGAYATGSTYGVYGSGTYGLYGAGNGYGVYGSGPTGVYGSGGSGTGVYGSGSFGVWGTGDDTGVRAYSSQGKALDVIGRAKFSTSGIATVASGSKVVTVSLTGVTSSDFVLATVQGNTAFSVRGALAGTDQLTIWLNKATTGDVTVAYFVISAS